MNDFWKDRIVTNPIILSGKPVIADTRISVEFILYCLASGWSMAELVENYPSISQEDIQAVLVFEVDAFRQKPFVRSDAISEGE